MDEIVPDGYKRCTVCRKNRPLECFGKDARYPDDLRRQCKLCRKSDGARYRAGGRLRIKVKVGLGMKWCPSCETEKPLAEFGNSVTTSDGKRSYCRSCNNQQADTYYEQNRDAAQARQRVYNRANYGTQRFHVQAFHARNPGKASAYSRTYRRRNPGANGACKQRRRARLRSAEGSFTEAEFKRKVQAYKGRCHWCRRKIVGPPVREHLIPLSKGGRNDIGNIVPSCTRCNNFKNAKMPWEFMEGRLL